MSQNTKAVNIIVKLQNVRLSFPQLFEAKAGDEPGSKPKFGATFLLHKVKNAADIGVVNRDLTPLVAADGKPYAGCYVNATVECYGYTHPKSGPGITWSLRNVQFVKDGDPFGAKVTPPENDFSALPDDEDGVV